MKKIAFLFLLACCVVVFFSCPGVPRCMMYGKGDVHLRVLDEDGTPLKYSDAKNFDVMDGGEDSKGKIKLLINEKDELIYKMTRLRVQYQNCKKWKKKDGFTDKEIMDALSGGGVFSIKDVRTSPIYKTLVNKPYIECYVSFERTLTPDLAYDGEPNHIYYCEVRLKRK